MSEWRHVEEWVEWTVEGRMDAACVPCLRRDPMEHCTTPTPDPSSPCGHEREDDGAPCGFRRSMGGHEFVDADHPHQPTRCTCGHSIEPVR